LCILNNSKQNEQIQYKYMIASRTWVRPPLRTNC